LSKEVRDRVFEAISQKNADTVDALLRLGDITEEGACLAKLLINEYADVSCLKTVLAPYTDTAEAEGALTELSDIFTALSALGYGGRININFSLIGNRSYYSGVVFKGYIKGIPDSVLSGGRYDGLMKKMGKHTGAIGFAVYLDSFERFKNEKREYDVDVLLLRSNDAPLESVILAAEGLSAEGLTVSVQDTVPEGLRYCKIMKISKEGLEKENGNA
jgi:ATP phosphoribosyltransferase regulatory subunit